MRAPGPVPVPVAFSTHRPLRRLSLASLLCLALPALLQAQEPAAVAAPVLDTIAVEGNSRLTAQQVISSSGLVVGRPTNYRDLQRAIISLFRTGQFDDVRLLQGETPDGRVVLRVQVRERPILSRWTVKGAQQLSEHSVRDRVRLTEGRPLDRAAVERARAAIDSMYRAQGYYAARVEVIQTTPAENQVGLVFDIREGNRVAISQIVVEGNDLFDDKEVAGEMGTKPEGFWWWRKGRYDDDKLQEDLREKLPAFYGSKGFIDFQVMRDSVAVDSTNGKAVLHIDVEEGVKYQVGGFQIIGNRRFSTEDLMRFYPFGADGGEGRDFNQTEWQAATDHVVSLYGNNGYIYAQVEPGETRRTGPNGESLIDLRWTIREGSPATVNKINIIGNDVTHERVIREAILLLPGELFSRDRLIRSYQNVSNLGFFQQPMAPPDVQPTDNGVDVDVTFRVEERRTGNVNFGASLGQGTGLGGFIGLEEPNLFGRGKRGRLTWQFGRNINDFTLSFTDPAIRESRISGTITLFNSRQRYTIGDLGRRRQVGGSVQFGFPLLGSRFTRLYTSYGLQKISYSGGSQDLQSQFRCSQCLRSTVGLSLVRDTRIGLPFATGGAYTNTSIEFNGGPLGGTGDYRKFEFEGRYYAPLGRLGGNDQLGSGIQLVLGLTARTGFIFGDAGPFFTELYSMGGTQYGLPLRGYEEFSITPNGFDPFAGGGSAAGSSSFGESFALFTGEAGARVSQSLYFNIFFDAGNVYRTAQQYDPSRLFRSVGIGAAVLSPLGPIGIDLGYGFDKVDFTGRRDPGWKLHFRLGNFF
jgi:outer membrane protein insertion porin family